jgi:hypothetical protein
MVFVPQGEDTPSEDVIEHLYFFDTNGLPRRYDAPASLDGLPRIGEVPTTVLWNILGERIEHDRDAWQQEKASGEQHPVGVDEMNYILDLAERASIFPISFSALDEVYCSRRENALIGFEPDSNDSFQAGEEFTQYVNQFLIDNGHNLENPDEVVEAWSVMDEHGAITHIEAGISPVNMAWFLLFKCDVKNVSIMMLRNSLGDEGAILCRFYTKK